MMYVKMMSDEHMPDHVPGKGFVLVEVPTGSHVKFQREMIQSSYGKCPAADGYPVARFARIVRFTRKSGKEEGRDITPKNTCPKVVIVHPGAMPNDEYYPDGNTYLMNEKGDTVAMFSYHAPESKKTASNVNVWYGSKS